MAAAPPVVTLVGQHPGVVAVLIQFEHLKTGSEVPLLEGSKQAREFLAYDLTGKMKAPQMLPPKIERDDHRDEQATSWQFDYQDRQCYSFYLRPFFGELKGWYLDFEEDGETLELACYRKTIGGPLLKRPYTRWKVKLSPKPGPQSLLRRHGKPDSK